MAWLIGVTPAMARRSIKDKICIGEFDCIVVTDRARELHVIARRGVDDGVFAWQPAFAGDVGPLPASPADD